MRKIKEVLRLRFEFKMGQREIARACSDLHRAIVLLDDPDHFLQTPPASVASLRGLIRSIPE